MPFPESPAGRCLPDDAAAFIKDHADLDAVEIVLADTNGVLRGKWLPGSALEKIFTAGVAFPYSLFGLDAWGGEVEDTGLHMVTGDRDGLAWPVAGGLSPVPWSERPTAQVVTSMVTPAGQPFGADPRNALAALVDAFARDGITIKAAFELEFYLLSDRGDSGAGPTPIGAVSSGPGRQNMYALADLDAVKPFLDDVRHGALVQGLAADAAVSEAAPGQFEFNLAHRDDPLRAADEAHLLRRLVGAMARRHGMVATFMAKPFADWPGNGMHVHASLATETGNLFAGPQGEIRLGHAVAGLLDTMAEAQILFVSSFNGFRRLQRGSYAPMSVCWGFDNRSVAVRVPASSEKARRVEHRIAGADANPYLVLAGVLVGMRAGLSARKVPPKPVTGNAYEQDIARLTSSMDMAVSSFRHSSIMREMLGCNLHRVIAALKQAESDVFAREITSLEWETYM